MNTKARALLACVFALAVVTSAVAQTPGPDEQRWAWGAGVLPPTNTHAQQPSHAAEGPLGDDVPAVPIQPLAQQARRLQAALEFLGQPFPKSTQDAINKATQKAPAGFDWSQLIADFDSMGGNLAPPATLRRRRA